MDFDWKAIVGLIVIVCVFMYAGIWWAILSIVITTVALGWKNRHDGPFPINRESDIPEEVIDEAKDLLQQAKILDDKIQKSNEEKISGIESKLTEFGFLNNSDKKDVKDSETK